MFFGELDDDSVEPISLLDVEPMPAIKVRSLDVCAGGQKTRHLFDPFKGKHSRRLSDTVEARDGHRLDDLSPIQRCVVCHQFAEKGFVCLERLGRDHLEDVGVDTARIVQAKLGIFFRKALEIEHNCRLELGQGVGIVAPRAAEKK